MRGGVPIENVKIGDVVITSKGKGEIIEKVYQGVQETIKIKHKFGSFECTAEHKIAVFTGINRIEFKLAADIVPGDLLVFDSSGYYGNKTSLPNYVFSKKKGNNTSTEIKIPDLCEDVAWLIGVVHGDGYVELSKDGHGRISIPVHKNHISERRKIISVFEKFGVVPTFTEYENYSVVRVHSTELAKYFYKNIKQPNTEICVPDWIRNAIPSIRSAYLAGVFDSDGSTKTRPINAVSTIYPKWLKELREIYISIGIMARDSLKRKSKVGKTKDWKSIFSLNISGNENLKLFEDIVSKHSTIYYNSRKIKEHSTNSFRFPTDMVRNTFKGHWIVSANKYTTTYRITRNTNLQFEQFPLLVTGIETGRKIETYDIEVSDIKSFVAEGILVHNSALISLSDMDDIEMRRAKQGAFYIKYPHRQLSNNSAVYEEKPSAVTFMNEWLALAESGSGDRGIFNRAAAAKHIPDRRKKVIRKDALKLGANPCCEILLRDDGEFCNLSEVVCRDYDNLDSLKEKVRIATIIGTYQSMFTDFKYISSDWKKNCEEERLLGVSLTGQWDCEAVRDESIEEELKLHAVEINRIYASRFGISQSTAITCTKPSGSVSKLVNSSSGVHPRYAKYYIQRVRLDAKDPLFNMLKEQGYPYVPEIGQTEENATRFVFAFPIKSPEGSITRHDLTAIQQLEYWRQVKRNYAEHTVSCTVYVRDDEWFKVGNWVYENFDDIIGVSFLPFDGGVYELAPNEEITEQQYNEMIASLPQVDFSRILVYEKEDETKGSKELACSSGSCEII